jgi:uncharacterized membrane protein
MIESLRALFSDPSYPSLHVVVIHLPIACIFLAPLFDVGCLVFRGRTWLDRTAAALYMLAAVGAGAAYLSGQRAAEVVAEITPAAEAAVADHASLAMMTLIAASAVAVFRLWVSWLSRNDRRISLGIFRLIALPAAVVALTLLALTADKGGELVYGHGLGVTSDRTESFVAK